MKAFLALFGILLAHYGPEVPALLGTQSANDVAWNFYILRGVEGTILCYLLLPIFQGYSGWIGKVGVFAVTLGMFEEAQTSVCGYVGKGLEVPLFSTLCIQTYGPWPYLAIVALILALMLNGIKRT